MVKEPEVGFMQATYWQLCMSFSVSFCRSYLRGDPRWGPATPPTPPTYTWLWNGRFPLPPTARPCARPSLCPRPAHQCPWSMCWRMSVWGATVPYLSTSGMFMSSMK